MLGSISWEQFTYFLLLATGGYYFYVLVRYYWRDAIAFFNRSRVRQAPEGEEARRGAVEASGRREGHDEEVTDGLVMVERDKGERSKVMPIREEDFPRYAAAGEQPGLFDVRAGLADPLSEPLPGQSPELFKVTEKVVARLKEVVSRGVDEGIDREELMDHIGEVLSGYGQLRRTPYQRAINNVLIRICSTSLSLVLTEEELNVLWR